MACPNVTAVVTYYHSTSSDGYDRDRCAACRHIFFTMDGEDDTEEECNVCEEIQ
ncbi:MAG: hypothetical protein ACOYL3_16220 [Desulfuromonadaceae bacterium]